MNAQMQDGYQVHHLVTGMSPTLMAVEYMPFEPKVQPSGFLPVQWRRGCILLKTKLIENQINRKPNI